MRACLKLESSLRLSTFHQTLISCLKKPKVDCVWQCLSTRNCLWSIDSRSCNFLFVRFFFALSFINENLHKISSVFSFHIRNFKNESRLVLLKPFYAFIYCAYLKKIAKNPVRIKTLIGLVSSLFDCVSVWYWQMTVKIRSNKNESRDKKIQRNRSDLNI